MAEREKPGDREPYWNNDDELGEIYLGHDHRRVRARSHIAAERFGGRGAETLFTLTERTGVRTYVQSHLFLTNRDGVASRQRLAAGQAWHYRAPCKRR